MTCARFCEFVMMRAVISDPLILHPNMAINEKTERVGYNGRHGRFRRVP